jgi:hypothetical protein
MVGDIGGGAHLRDFSPRGLALLRNPTSGNLPLIYHLISIESFVPFRNLSKSPNYSINQLLKFAQHPPILQVMLGPLYPISPISPSHLLQLTFSRQIWPLK